MTFSFAILLVNLQTTGLGPGMAFLVGVRWAISISGIEISTPAAWKRLRHNIIVSNADSLAFISGRPTILRCIDNCSAESARWISQSLPLVFTGHSGVTRAVANFYPLTAEGHRKIWHKIAGCSKSRPVISPVDSLRRHCGDISIVDAKFERILKVFKFFFPEQQFRIWSLHFL